MEGVPGHGADGPVLLQGPTVERFASSGSTRRSRRGDVPVEGAQSGRLGLRQVVTGRGLGQSLLHSECENHIVYQGL